MRTWGREGEHDDPVVEGERDDGEVICYMLYLFYLYIPKGLRASPKPLRGEVYIRTWGREGEDDDPVVEGERDDGEVYT